MSLDSLIEGAHFWIDRGKAVLENEHRPAMRRFPLNQGLHVVSLFVVWKLWLNLGAEAVSGLTDTAPHRRRPWAWS